jgi:succinylglutamic semialdehyde dehydrogenase
VEAFKTRCPENIRELPQGRSTTRHKAHGVVAVLGPFNFPAHLPNGHIVPSLLAGNSVIFKPSEYTPKTAEIYLKLWREAKLPLNVLQLAEGGPEVGAALLDQNIQGVFFTGSLQTGLKIRRKFAERPDVIVALEMGGNNPLVISEISDPHAASYLTIQSAFITSGQRCSAARRLILVESASGQAYLKELVHMVQSIKIGYWDEKPEPFMGPLISEHAARQVLAAYENLKELGGSPLLELKQIDGALLSPGLIDMTGIRDIPDEEIFGPLLQVFRVKNFNQALELASKTKYGLTAGLFSSSFKEYEKFFMKMKAGIINWNTPLTGASSYAPFGGVGMSGNHRPSAFYAADYAGYPVASLELSHLKLPSTLPPGISGVKK